jgi:hypothetical protein
VRNGAAVQDLATGAVLVHRPLAAEAHRAALDAMLRSGFAGVDGGRRDGVVPIVEEGPRHGECLYTLPPAQWNAAVPLYVDAHLGLGLTQQFGAPWNAAVQVYVDEWQRAGHVRHVESPEALYDVREPSWIGACGGRDAALEVYSALRSLQSAAVFSTANLSDGRAFHYTSVMPVGCSKATALATFAAERGIGLADVLAVGDYYNDVDMLAEVGWGVAMGQAPDTVKAVADAVVPDNTQDGAAVAIERFLLGDA